jgi:glycosyltransferase involved in cell wall biosynthesis
MRILFLSDNFPPEVNAPASRTYEHCREWACAGHEVTVITGVPNFPTGRIYAGYRNRLWQSETIDGIRVIRVWTYIAANEGVLRRSLDYLSYMASATVAGVFVPRPDIVVGTSPQFFTVLAAYLVSRLRRRPFIFELRDLWPESIKAVGAMRESRVLRWMERVELFLYRKAAAIVSVTESFKDNLAARGIDASKIEIVTNGVDLSRYSPRPKDAELVKQLNLEGKFVAGYVGTHGMAHGLETVLAAAERIRDSLAVERYAFLLLGDGARKEHLRQLAACRRLENVIFIDSVPKDQVARYWSLLDVAIIHLRRLSLFETVIPSKLFECMAMGIPVLHGVRGESARIVERTGVGLCFEPENPESLVTSLRTIGGNPALLAAIRKACVAAAPNFARERLALKMLQVLTRTAASHGSQVVNV